MGKRSWFLALLVLLGAQAAPHSAIVVVVTDHDGAALPGVQVKAVQVTPESGGNRAAHIAYTDIAGSHEFSGLSSGVYEIQAELSGFCTERREGVRLGERTSVAVVLKMWPAFTEEIHWAVLRLREAAARADVIAHLRITKSHPPRLRGHADCGLVTTEFEAQVFGEAKLDSEHWPDAPRARFTQLRAGTWSNGIKTLRGGETPLRTGDEYVAFLRWNPDEETFDTMLGPHWMIPVREGRIVRYQGNGRGVVDGTLVVVFLGQIRGLAR